jgi:hypothetical protein
MKITKEHYEILKSAIALLPASMVAEHKLYIIEEGKAKDVDKRLRWDTLYASRIKIGDGIGMSGLPLYKYMNNTHIDTALKAIMKELGH